MFRFRQSFTFYLVFSMLQDLLRGGGGSIQHCASTKTLSLRCSETVATSCQRVVRENAQIRRRYYNPASFKCNTPHPKRNRGTRDRMNTKPLNPNRPLNPKPQTANPSSQNTQTEKHHSAVPSFVTAFSSDISAVRFRISSKPSRFTFFFALTSSGVLSLGAWGSRFQVQGEFRGLGF